MKLVIINFILLRDDLAFDVIGYTFVLINDFASAANSEYFNDVYTLHVWT